MPRITFLTTGKVLDLPDDGDPPNLLRVAIRNDCGLPWRCASGNCGTDRVRVVEGAGNITAPRKRERERLGELVDQDYRLACQSYVEGDISIEWDPDQRGLDEDSAAGARLKERWLGAADSA